jgi:hypothetical protein
MSRLSYQLKCETCGSEFIGKKSDAKNCSKECRDKAKNLKRKQVNDEKLAARLVSKPCKVCGEMFIPNKFKIDIQVYCGQVCQGKDMHIMRTQKPGYHEQRAAYKREWWKTNTDEKREKNRFYSYRSRYDGNYIPALERDNYTCVDCGETDRDKLDIHHKDHSGNTDTPNHSLDNLETLCRSCHMKHHNSEEHNIHKHRIPNEVVLDAIYSTINSAMAARKLGVATGWIYKWRSKNKSLLSPIPCPVCNTNFIPNNVKRYCSPNCAYEDKVNKRKKKV